MKTLKIGLLGRIIIAITLGAGLGLVTPLWGVRILTTFNGIFSQFLGFAIPLIILGLVTPAIADIGNRAGKMLLLTVAIAYGSTVLSGLISYFTGAAVFPSMIDTKTTLETASETIKATPYFQVDRPPLMDVMTALVLAFTVGLGLASSKNETLMKAAHGFEEIVIKTIKVAIIPLLPVYIFGIFLNITFEGEVVRVLSVFLKIIGVIFVLHIGVLLIQFCIAGALTKRNPLRLLATMLPAYFTALGTQSSAATIPVTLEQTKKNKVSEDIAGFTIPLCATIHMPGSILKIVACSLAIMIMQGMHYDFTLFIGFIFMLSITMVAAPGVPGGAIMAALGILQTTLGFTAEDQALIIAIYIAIDCFGTACNVTGDGAIALVIDHLLGKNRKSA